MRPPKTGRVQGALDPGALRPSCPAHPFQLDLSCLPPHPPRRSAPASRRARAPKRGRWLAVCLRRAGPLVLVIAARWRSPYWWIQRPITPVVCPLRKRPSSRKNSGISAAETPRARPKTAGPAAAVFDRPHPPMLPPPAPAAGGGVKNAAIAPGAAAQVSRARARGGSALRAGLTGAYLDRARNQRAVERQHSLWPIRAAGFAPTPSTPTWRCPSPKMPPSRRQNIPRAPDASGCRWATAGRRLHSRGRDGVWVEPAESLAGRLKGRT